MITTCAPAPWRRQSEFTPFLIILPCDFHTHLPTTCPSLGFRTSGFSRSPGPRVYIGKGAMPPRGEGQPGSAPTSSTRPGPFTPPAWYPLAPSVTRLSAPSQAQVPSPIQGPSHRFPKPINLPGNPVSPRGAFGAPLQGNSHPGRGSRERAGSGVAGRAG